MTDEQTTTASWRRGLSAAILRSIYRIVESNNALLTIATIVVAGSLALSISTSAWHWFQRSGALVVSIGTVFSTRKALKSVLFEIVHNLNIREQLRFTRADESQTDITACAIGFCLVATGTLTWAYGDLVGCLVSMSCF